MKSTTLMLLLFAVFIPEVLGDDKFFSKFLQHGYKIKDRRTEVTRYNKSVYHTFEIKTFKYNRTTTAFNATVRPKVNMGDKLEGIVQTYKFLSNEYRHFPIRFQENVKRAFDANVLGAKDILKCGNTTNVIFQKDITYHVCNFVADETRLPPLIPNGIYKVEITLLYLNKEVAVFSFFGEVYTPRDYPKEAKTGDPMLSREIRATMLEKGLKI